MSAVLAVDGGQSGIRLRHSAQNRIVEVDGVSRAGGTEASVAQSIADGWIRGGFPAIDRVVLGLTTAPVDAVRANRLCSLVATATGAREVWLADDTVTSHAGALSGGYGISLVAGTGVACLAVPEHGDPKAFDGHGYLLGDDGGGFWIGRAALREVLRARDRSQSISLAGAAWARYGELDGLHVRLHDSSSTVNDIAQFARDVLSAAEGDTIARRIVDDAATELHSTIMDAAQYIGGRGIPIALGGRLLQSGSPLRTRLDDLIGHSDALVPRSADAGALDGAIRLGLADDPGHYRGLVHCWKDAIIT